MKALKKLFVLTLKQADLGSALAVRLTQLTGKSKIPLHPKHLLTQKPWFTHYLEKTDIILDLGCGNGQNAIKAAKKVKKIVACDNDLDLINLGEIQADSQKIKNIKFEIANLEEKLKYKNNSFDKITFLDVLEHLQKRDQVLSEIKRILKPEGLLFIGVPNSQTSWKKLQRSAGICSYSDQDHKIEFSESSIKKLLKRHKFKIMHFGYGKYDIFLRGLLDIIGSFSLSLYKIINNWRQKQATKNPKEASGFEIIAINIK